MTENGAKTDNKTADDKPIYAKVGAKTADKQPVPNEAADDAPAVVAAPADTAAEGIPVAEGEEEDGEWEYYYEDVEDNKAGGKDDKKEKPKPKNVEVSFFLRSKTKTLCLSVTNILYLFTCKKSLFYVETS